MTSAADYTRGYADGFAHASVDPSGSALYGNGYRAGASDAGANRGPTILTGDAPHEGDVLTYTNGHWDALPPTGGGGEGAVHAFQGQTQRSAPAEGSLTLIDWTGAYVIADTDGYLTEDGAIVVPDGLGGLYQVSAQLWWSGDAGGSLSDGCAVSNGSTVTIPSGSSTAVEWGTNDWVHSMYFDPDNPTRVNRWKRGWYFVYAEVEWEASADGNSRNLELSVGGVAAPNPPRSSITPNPNGGVQVISGAVPLDVPQNQYLELVAGHDAGHDLGIMSASMSVVPLRTGSGFRRLRVSPGGSDSLGLSADVPGMNQAEMQPSSQAQRLPTLSGLILIDEGRFLQVLVEQWDTLDTFGVDQVELSLIRLGSLA